MSEHEFRDWMCPTCCLEYKLIETRTLPVGRIQQCYNCENFYEFKNPRLERVIISPEWLK